jgi:hypothetical protein
MFEKITESELEKRAVAAVSNTPTRYTPFGESNMSALELKARFDKLPRYLAERLNEIFQGLADGSLSQSAMVVNGDTKISVGELLSKLLTGDTSDIKIQTLTRTITLDELGNMAVRHEDEMQSGEIAQRLMLWDDVSLRIFARI